MVETVCNDLPEMAPIEEIFRRAMDCSDCFVCPGSTLRRAMVDLAQPRPIGEGYWTSELRIVLVHVNPSQADDKILNDLQHAYRNGSGTLAEINRHLEGKKPNLYRRRLKRIYLKGLGLKLADLALANIAWCATKDNKYPIRAMLEPCFASHTSKLLEALKPDVVLLAGHAAHRFCRKVRAMCPNAEVVETLHCSHRKDSATEDAMIKRVREILDRVLERKRNQAIAGDRSAER